ncbi:tetratricopeptide repeat protein [Streptomyces sp. Tu 3180]|uniref:tetratricopeptide repeat protein n=1 Tax=Streptomyces sp. Tu 3180 TaxID=2682611 RepID=UPI001358F4EA|nr:tetratricopeptide repeat protein [Streptomyces sp. Tu 3180]KAF3466901.1 tetratricopeptide repeat protein [Streptomyces sp. Tu 3180]
MARLSRGKKREHNQAARAANRAAVPVDVRVPAAGADPGGASVGGVPVTAAPGEEIQQAVLNHLHRIALASGRAVLATVHDERIGYVLPLRVDPDGSSHFTAPPAPAGPAREERGEQGEGRRQGPAQVPAQGPAQVPAQGSAQVPAQVREPVRGPGSDRPTHVLRSVPEPEAAPERGTAPGPGADVESGAGPEPAPVRDATPTFPLRSVPEARVPGDSAPTFPLRAVPAPAEAAPPGTVAPPTGEFGPPPPMDAWPHPAPAAGHPGNPAFRSEPSGPTGSTGSTESAGPVGPVGLTGPISLTEPTSLTGRTAGTDRTPDPAPSAGRRHPGPPFAEAVPDAGPDPKPTPPRGFDAVAEAVLGDEPLTAPGDAATPALLAEPMARINDAVRAGRLDTAAQLARQTVTESSATLGPEHPEVLRLRELTAYIAYLAGEPLHAFRLSLDLAGIHRRTGDAEAAYGNVRSAATAWRAVRDARLGLELGHELIGLWTELTAEDGPAADEIEELESARARMGRLTERARARQD